MHDVVIRGGKDLQTARIVQLLQSSAALPLGDARRIVECILRGESAQVSARSTRDAHLLAAALARLGASANVKTGVDGEGG
jgi:hypothetical protein